MPGAGLAGPARAGRLASIRLAALLAAACVPAARAGSPPGPAIWSGWSEARGEAYFEQSNHRDPAAVGSLALLLQAEGQAGPVFLRGSLRAEGLSYGGGKPAFDPADREWRRSPAGIRELYLRFGLRPSLDLEAGRFLLGWGKTDGYSPADAFLPRDATDPFADEKLPLWGARLSGQRGQLRFELVGIVPTTTWRLPPLEGRFAPVETGRVSLAEGDGDPPTSGLAALRLLWTRGDWDLGAWTRGGTRPAPLLEPRPERARPAGGLLEVPVDRRWVRESGAGAEVSRLVGAWVLRAEVGLLFSGDAELGDAVLIAAGFERTVLGGTLVGTLAGNARDTPVDPALLFDRAFLPGLIAGWTRDYGWGAVHLAWTAAFDHGDGLVKAETTFTLTDRWAWTVGTDLPYGPDDGPLGALGAARRVRTAVRRSW